MSISKFIISFIIYSVIVVPSTKAQSIDPQTEERLQKVRTLYRNSLDSGRYVTGYIFDRIITEMHNTISGTLIKEGKTIATTASLEDESITVNHLITWLGDRLSMQLTASGSSEDGFVNIFSGGKYKRTLTGGFNFNFFPSSNTAGYFGSDKYLLWKRLQSQDSCFKLNSSTLIMEKTQRLVQLENLFARCSTLLCRPQNIDSLPTRITDETLIPCDTCQLKDVVKFQNILAELSEYYPEEFDKESCVSVGNFIRWVSQNRNNIANDLANRQNLEILDSLQINTNWTRFKYNWWTGSVKVNQKNNPLFDATAADDLYTRNDRDVYVSASLAFNFMYVSMLRNNTHYIAPKIRYQNNRDFDEDDLLNIEKKENFLVNGDSLQSIKSTAFYQMRAARKHQFSFELPYVLYYPKSGLGLDLAVGTKFAGGLDDLYARIGVYLPIATDEDNYITVEPLLRFNNLHNGGNLFKDMLSFGFNVSVSVPKFLKE